MEDNEFIETVIAALGAAQNFLDTDAAYGPDDPRTLVKKERLANAMTTLTPSNVDIPELHVMPSNHVPTFPVEDPQRWSQVRAYLTHGCEVPAVWVDALHEEGKIYADLQGNAVFVGEDEHRTPSTVYLRGMGVESTGTRPGVGWFTARLPVEDATIPPVLIIAESPVDALSVLEMHRRLYRDRPDGKNERGAVTVVATEGAGVLPHRAIRETLDRGGIVRVATDNTPAGELVWQHLREQYPIGQVMRYRPSMKDWNDELRFHNACYRDPAEADRQLRKLQMENAPDAQSRAEVHKAIRRWGPTPRRDGWDHER
jgi:hypothetical protein